MARRCIAPVLLGAIFFASGALWWDARTRPLAFASKDAHAGAPAEDSWSPQTFEWDNGSGGAAAEPQPGGEAPARPEVVLAPDAAAVLAEQVTLQLLAADSGLQLTGEQWQRLAAAIVDLQAVRHAYEASIARAMRVGPGRYRLDIPAYPEAGDALRGRLQAELATALGAPVAGQVIARLGDGLERHFAGFGVGVQTLEFAAGEAGADYAVTRTMTFWNSHAGAEQLSTRRETHFPAREDPSGHQWGPFLATLVDQLAPRARS